MMYQITAQAETLVVGKDGQEWHGSRQIATFYVDAYNAHEAETVARGIVDTLGMFKAVHITTAPVPELGTQLPVVNTWEHGLRGAPA